MWAGEVKRRREEGRVEETEWDISALQPRFKATLTWRVAPLHHLSVVLPRCMTWYLSDKHKRVHDSWHIYFSLSSQRGTMRLESRQGEIIWSSEMTNTTCEYIRSICRVLLLPWFTYSTRVTLLFYVPSAEKTSKDTPVHRHPYCLLSPLSSRCILGFETSSERECLDLLRMEERGDEEAQNREIRISPFMHTSGPQALVGAFGIMFSCGQIYLVKRGGQNFLK